MPPEENNGTPEGVAESLHDAHIDDAVNETSAQDQPGDDAAAAAPEGEAQAKPRKSAQERIDELTRARREAERDVEYWRAKALQGSDQQPKPQTQEAPQADAKPDPQDYENGVYDPQFIEDLTEWKADQAATRRLAEREVQESGAAALRSFHEKAKASLATMPDFYDVVGDGLEKVGPLLSEPMQLAISASDEAPALSYHFAKNPAEARRIAALNPIAQAVEIGRLEARLAAPAKPTPKTATDAPEPPPQARGQGGRFAPAPDTNDFSAFEKMADGVLHKGG